MPQQEDEIGQHRGAGLWARIVPLGALGILCAGAVYVFASANLLSVEFPAKADDLGLRATTTAPAPPPVPALDKAAYDRKLLSLAHVATSTLWYRFFLTGTTTPAAGSERAGSTTAASSSPPVLRREPWPVKTVYPNVGALLPFNRIVAYYGNFYSTQMGVLGEYDPATVVAKLQAAAALWRAADPGTPVIPAIDYIAVTAQGSAGKDGMYRLRMPDDQIDKAISMADQVHGIVILDMQVGKSTLQAELPQYEKYLKMPNVHLAIDPEFSMKGAAPPGTVIGTFTSADVNFAVQYLDKLVADNGLPPKILVVHRFTEDMVTGYRNIKPTPNVEIVMDMDGWGFPAKKINTYKYVIASEPVQFTGFKLFYKADLRPPSTRMLTPQEILSLTPAPIFIQYQ